MALASWSVPVGAEGLTATGSQFFHLDSPEIGLGANAYDCFGAALAAGDFDGNGYDDLAIGVPEWDLDIPYIPDYGVVILIYYANGGVLRTDTLTESLLPNYGREGFGHGLAAGDFNGDGFDDLAVGSYPTADCLCSFDTVETIDVIGGGSDGLDPFPIGAYNWLESSKQLFSVVFTAGDFYNNGFDALATASSDGGGTTRVSWYATPLAQGSESNAKILAGSTVALAAGDVDGDGWDELAAGQPFVAVSGQAGAGSVTLYSAEFFMGGFSGFGSAAWNQDNPVAIVGGAEAGDNFGFAVGFGDTNGDGYDDLIAGVPGEETTYADMGAYQRIPGSASGLTTSGNQLYGVGIETEMGARAGSTIATGNFDDADTAAEVAVGIRLDDVGGVVDAGMVSIAFTSATNTYWHQDVPGIADSAEADDHFGGRAIGVLPGVMAVGDFNGDGADDLVISVPDEDIGVETDAGAVHVLYGTPPNGCLAVPSGACLSGFGKAQIALKEKSPGKESMSAKWLKGPAATSADLGNPLDGGGTTYTMCVYADGTLAGSYLVDRAGDDCAGKPCWKSVGGTPPDNKGYKYKDKDAAAYGVQQLQLKGGDAGKSGFLIKGKNNAAKNQTSLPTNVVAEMTGSLQATIQLFGSDMPNCYSATLNDIQKDDGVQFKARH